MLRASLLILLCLGFWGCHSSVSRVPPDDSLPTHVAGASDAMIAWLQEKLTKQGAHIVTTGQMYMVSIPSKLIFADQSPQIQWESYELLNTVVCYLQQFRKIEVHVNAYSSCYLSERRTRALTLARSRAIANYLWSQNIETRMVITQGMGDTRPIVALTKCTDSSANSRVEIIFRRAVA